MKRFIWPIVIVAFVVFYASGGTLLWKNTSKQILSSGKVALVKYRSFLNDQFVYGAFVISNATLPARQPNNTVTNTVTYHWVLDGPDGRTEGQATIGDSSPIQFGETNAAPGARAFWSYRNPMQGYIEPGTYGANGTYLCVTEFEQIPEGQLSEVSCEYVEPKAHNK